MDVYFRSVENNRSDRHMDVATGRSIEERITESSRQFVLPLIVRLRSIDAGRKRFNRELEGMQSVRGKGMHSRNEGIAEK